MKDFETLSTMQVCEVELVYRNKVRPDERPMITTSSMAYEAMMAVWDVNKIELIEQSKIILLDTSMKCLGVVDISTGGIAQCLIDPRIVFAAALKGRATSILLAHNHPSGNLKPSKPDINMTDNIVKAGNLLQIKLEDHLIVTTDGYYSMRDNGYIPS